MTAFFCLLTSLTNLTASERFSSVTASLTSASTPLVVPVPLAMVFISDILPRITENCTSSISLNVVSVRSAEAPAPTGSSITGCPSRAASFPASIMDAIVLSLRVPMLIARALQIAVISFTSRMSSAIIGAAPAASKMFAQSLTVT